MWGGGGGERPCELINATVYMLILSSILTKHIRMTCLRPRLVRFMLWYKTYLSTTEVGSKTALKSYFGPFLSNKTQNALCYDPKMDREKNTVMFLFFYFYKSKKRRTMIDSIFYLRRKYNKSQSVNITDPENAPRNLRLKVCNNIKYQIFKKSISIQDPIKINLIKNELPYRILESKEFSPPPLPE